MTKRTLLERFKENYAVDITTGCWEWAGCK